MLIFMHITDFVSGPFLVWPLALQRFLGGKEPTIIEKHISAKVKLWGWVCICVGLGACVLAFAKNILGKTQDGGASPGITWLMIILALLMHVNAYTISIKHMEASIADDLPAYVNSWFWGVLCFIMECVFIIDMLTHGFYIK